MNTKYLYELKPKERFWIGRCLTELSALIGWKLGVSKEQATQMLRNPQQGANRQRLMSALIEMGLTETAAEKFINQNAEK